MSEPVERFCEVVCGLSDEDAKTVISIAHMGVGGTHADMFLPELEKLQGRLIRLVEFGVFERFLVPGLFAYLIDHFRKWVEHESVEESIDANLGLLEDLRADLLRPPEQRHRRLTDLELRDLIGKIQGVVPRKHAQREQGQRIIVHLEAEQVARFDSFYWRDWIALRARESMR